MTEEAGPASEHGNNNATGLGAALRAARLDKGMSVRDVAEALNLHERTVEALEGEDWAALPPGPFTTGYARSCAHLLALDPGFVESCLGTRTPTREREAPLRPQMTAPTGRRRGSGRWVMAVLVSLVLLGVGSVVGWWWLEQQGMLTDVPGGGDATETAGGQEEDPASIDDNLSTDDDASDNASAEEAVGDRNAEPTTSDSGEDAGDGAAERGGDAAPPEPDLAAPPSTLNQDLSPPEGMEGGDSVAAAEGGDAGRERSGEETQTGGGTTAPPADATAAGDDLPDLERPSPQPRSDSLTGMQEDRELPDGEPGLASGTGDEASGTVEAEREDTGDAAERGEIEVELTGPSWVEITDGSGERLLYGLIRDEGRRTLTGELPFSVVIGDVTQVDVFYDGDPVDLGTDEPGRVARVEVP